MFILYRTQWQTKGGRGGGCHPDPEISGEAVSKKTFLALQASVWSKNKREAVSPGPSPGSATRIAICNKAKLRRAGL